MESFNYDEIMLRIENYFKNLGYEPKFTDDGNDYQNTIAFWVEDENRKVVIQKQKKPISEISTLENLEKYLQWLKSRYGLA